MATRYEQEVRGADFVKSVESDNVGFDLLSVEGIERRCIEVKGRAGVGNVELTWSEFAKAIELGDDYWLYVVLDCASPSPTALPGAEPGEASRLVLDFEPRRAISRRTPACHRRCRGSEHRCPIIDLIEVEIPLPGDQPRVRHRQANAQRTHLDPPRLVGATSAADEPSRRLCDRCCPTPAIEERPVVLEELAAALPFAASTTQRGTRPLRERLETAHGRQAEGPGLLRRWWCDPTRGPSSRLRRDGLRPQSSRAPDRAGLTRLPSAVQRARRPRAVAPLPKTSRSGLRLSRSARLRPLRHSFLPALAGARQLRSTSGCERCRVPTRMLASTFRFSVLSCLQRVGAVRGFMSTRPVEGVQIDVRNGPPPDGRRRQEWVRIRRFGDMPDLRCYRPAA